MRVNYEEKCIIMSEEFLYKENIAVPKLFDFKNLEELITLLRRLSFLQYYNNANGQQHKLVSIINKKLDFEISKYIMDSRRKKSILNEFFEILPMICELANSDIDAAYKGDPAAGSPMEIILTYPGPFSIMIQRIAHEFYKMEVPILPRIFTEFAHSITGIDIHPGANIGHSFL